MRYDTRRIQLYGQPISAFITELTDARISATAW
jgi:hypothetical protein